jgi:hypothetical protein
VESRALTPDSPAVAVTSAWRRFMFLYLVVLVALPALALFVFSGPLYWWWIERFEGPDLAEEFGFEIEVREVALASGGRWHALTFVAITPGGRFDRAGVTQGDVVACLYHGKGDFWGKLLLAREGYEAEFKVVPFEKLSLGCDGARQIRLEGRSLHGRREPPNKALKLTRSAMVTRTAALAA